MRMIGIMGIGIGLILALICHLIIHIIPIGILAAFIVLGTERGFCDPKHVVQKPSKTSGSWFRMRGGC